MGSWWRSEDMTYVNLIMTEEAAQSCVRELGAIGCIQFVDLNPDLTPFQRQFVSYIKRCDELERKIKYCSQEIKNLGLSIQPVGTTRDFIEKKSIEDQGQSGSYLLESLEGELANHESNLRALVEYNKKLSKQFTEKVEYHHLLLQSTKFLDIAQELSNQTSPIMNSGRGNHQRDSDSHYDSEIGVQMSPLIHHSNGDDDNSYHQSANGEMSMLFSNIAGLVSLKDKTRFERMIFRSSRGNCYIRFSDLKEDVVDADGESIEKSCFVIFYKSAAIGNKITRICDAFGCNRHDLSMLNDTHALKAMLRSNQEELREAKEVLDKNTSTRYALCDALSHRLEDWYWTVKREKSVYHSLNQFRK
jgi:V-type H+-transporting ATPase subunit a